MLHAIPMLFILAANAAPAHSHLVISSDGPKLRVSIDGKNYGTFTSKSVDITDLAPGKHDVVVSWKDIGLNHLIADTKTVYKGKLVVKPGVEMRVHAAEQGIEVTDEVAMASAAATPAPAQPAAAAAPAQSFGNAPSNLHLNSEKWMTMVLVDGNALQQSDCTTPKACVASDLAPGQHELEIRGGALGGKSLYRGYVNIGGSAEVYGKVLDNDFKIYNVQPRTDVAPATVAVAPAPVAAQQTTTTTTTTYANGQPAGGGVAMGMTFIDPDTGEAVHMGVSAGPMGATSSVHTTETHTTTTTTVNGGAAVAVAPAPAPSGKGAIELTSEDGESFTVYLDGKKLGTFNGLEGQSIKFKALAAGEHKLEIKDFMEDKTVAEGRLFVNPGFELKLGKKGSMIEAFNNQNAWQQYR